MKIKIKNLITFILLFNFIFTVLFLLSLCKFSQLTATNLIFVQNSNKIRIFCLILTSNKNIDTKVKLTYDSWAQKCDSHKFITIIPDHLRSNLSNSIESAFEPIEYRNDFHLFQPPGLTGKFLIYLTV